MKKTITLVSTALVAALCSLSVHADKVYYVDPDGNAPEGMTVDAVYNKIGTAINNVTADEPVTIYLKPNHVFTENDMTTGTNRVDLTIIGENTTINSNAAQRILRTEAARLALKGITFSGVKNYTSMGGGLFFAGNTLVVDSCQFIDNESGSGGSGVASRGKDVIVRNSYFDGNYVNSGYGTGAAIVQAGVNNGDAGTLLVENCTFYRNDLNGVGSAISTKDAGAGYTNVKEVKIVNSIFISNTSELTNQAAIDVTDSSGEAAIKLINNTFYDNDGALRIGDIYGSDGGELIMINNLIFANMSGIFGADGYSVADLRDPIIGYNNIVVGGERGVNENIDDECFNDKKDQYNNRVETTATYPLSMVALSTTLSTDNYVPYLALTAENSDAVNAGYASGVYADLIPTVDIRGYGVAGTRDIGAYEYGGVPVPPSAISSLKADEADSFVFTQNSSEITVVNTDDREMTLTVVDLLGRTIYSAQGTGMLTVNKGNIDSRCVVLVVNDGVNKKAQKMILY